jgi:hypothetical protein
VLWQRLLEARNHYIDWQEFYLWVRSILEVEHRLPAWLRDVLDDRCPGFLEKEGRGADRPTSKRLLHLCLEDWIEDEVFGSAKKEGWFNAVAYYAIRDLRYQRAEVCWSECVKKWKNRFAIPLSTSGEASRQSVTVPCTFRPGDANRGHHMLASVLIA